MTALVCRNLPFMKVCLYFIQKKKLKERLISPNNGHAPLVVSRQICEHCKDGNVTLKDLICWDNWTIFLDTYGKYQKCWSEKISLVTSSCFLIFWIVPREYNYVCGYWGIEVGTYSRMHQRQLLWWLPTLQQEIYILSRMQHVCWLLGLYQLTLYHTWLFFPSQVRFQKSI